MKMILHSIISPGDVPNDRDSGYFIVDYPISKK